MIRRIIPALVCFIAAGAVHLSYFPYFLSGITGPMSGRRLFVFDSYTWSEVWGQTWTQGWHLVLSHGIPTALIGVAMWLLFQEAGETRTLPRWLLPFSTLFVLGGSLGAQYAFLGIPITVDEYSHTFQSRILRLQELSIPAYGPAEYLEVPFIKSNPWMGTYPPGWAAFLALFPTDILWLAPPIASVLALGAVYWLATLVGTTSQARLGTFLVALSPGYYWQGGTYFPHHLHLALLALGTSLFIFANRKNKILIACLSGLILSWAFVTRPVETALFGATVIVWALLFRRRFPIARAPLTVTLLSGAVGCLAYGIFSQHVGEFYLELERQLRHHFVAGLWNFYYPLIRTLAWWTPFYLSLILYAMKRAKLTPGHWFLLLHGAATVVAFAIFIDNGQVEYGSRYWITGWNMMAPVVGAGAESWLVQRLGGYRPRCFLLAVVLLSLYALSPFNLLYSEARSRAHGVLPWAQQYYPSDSIIFVRSTPQNNPTELIRNLPRSTQTWLLFLDPDRNRALRKVWSKRPAFVLDWENGNYKLTPFEEAAVNDSRSKMHAANHLSFFLGRRQRGIELWKSVPEQDPYFAAARLNSAIALSKLNRPDEAAADFELARKAGIPESTIQRLKRQNRL